jgi:hypothetical protein
MIDTRLFYSISVARIKLSKLKIPETVVFNLDEDLDCELKTTDSQDKLNFIYTALVDKYYKTDYRKFVRYLKYLEKLLLDAGVKAVVFENLLDGKVFNEHTDFFKSWYKEKYRAWKHYSINSEKMEDELFEELICHSNRRLISFLFSNKSVLNIQEDVAPFKRTDLGPEKNTKKVSYGWTWFC